MNKILKKIAKKLLLILPVSPIDWAVKKILEFYEEVQTVNTSNKKEEVRPLNFKHYLPGTEERIKKLRKVINKRPVAIVLPGSSVRELEQRIRELKDCDVCYSGLNAFSIVEKHILQKINRNLSIAMCSSYPEIEMNNIIDFLERQEDNIFISAEKSFQLAQRKKALKDFDLDKFIEKYDKKLLFFTFVRTPFILTMRGTLLPQIPNREYPLHFRTINSFSILLSLALIGGASKVVIFGGDGGRINTQEHHFRKSDFEILRESDFETQNLISQSYMIDTKVFNAMMPLILKRIYKIYNLEPVDIINCSERSHYTPFRKLSYDETFALLKSLKNKNLPR